MEAYRGKKIENLIQKRIKSKNPKVLDIGCGMNNEYFKFKNYTGIDINNYGLPYEIININLNEMDPKLPFDDGSFDIVMATEFLEHIFRPDALAKEINRVVSKKGVIIISLPNEFTLNCRIGFMMNKVLNHGFAPFTHKYIFNVTKIDEFMNSCFKPIGRSYACMGHFWNKMPDFLNDFLAYLSPSLFAKSVIYLCEKRNF